MKLVRDILQKKGSDIWIVEADSTVFSALELMSEKQIGALVILRKGELCGIFSERDYARKVVLKGKSSKDTRVADLMTCDVCYVSPQQTIEECMALMTDKHIRHLPVLDNEKLVGVISIGDLVMAIMAEKEFLIEQMANYIHGER